MTKKHQKRKNFIQRVIVIATLHGLKFDCADVVILMQVDNFSYLGHALVVGCNS